MANMEGERFLGQPTPEASGQVPQEESITEPGEQVMPERKDSPNRTKKPEKESEFKKSKTAASEFLERERAGEDTGGNFYENEGKLDDNVRELVRRFNDLPFLYTTGCCGGHIINKESLLRKFNGEIPRGTRVPPEGFAVYISGSVNFEIDSSPRSLEFVEKLSELVKKFEGAEFSEPDISYPVGIVKFGEITGRAIIDINRAKELEAKREALKSEIIKLAEEFL